MRKTTMTPEPTDKLDIAASVVMNGPEGELPDWSQIDWRTVERNVRRLRQRIFTASKAGDLSRVRRLQKLMLRSRCNTLVSVRRVTERNAGRLTAGVDGEVVLTPEAKMRLVERIEQNTEAFKALPSPPRLLTAAARGDLQPSPAGRLRRATRPPARLLHLRYSSAFSGPASTSSLLKLRGTHKIEYRLFSFISKNWRGRPLVSYEVIINSIAATTTSTGLQVYARLDQQEYPKVEVSDAELAAVNLMRDPFHPEWLLHQPINSLMDDP